MLLLWTKSWQRTNGRGAMNERRRKTPSWRQSLRNCRLNSACGEVVSRDYIYKDSVFLLFVCSNEHISEGTSSCNTAILYIMGARCSSVVEYYLSVGRSVLNSWEGFDFYDCSKYIWLKLNIVKHINKLIGLFVLSIQPVQNIWHKPSCCSSITCAKCQHKP